MKNRSAPIFPALRMAVLAGTALSLVPTSPGFAQQRSLTITSGVSVEERYTDNVNLDPEGFEESSFITSVTPFVGLGLDRRRVQGNVFLSGSLDYRTHDDSFKFRPDSTGRLNAELLDELFFVEVAGAVTRRRDDERNPLGGAPGTGLRETRTSAFWSVEPSLQGRLGRLLEGNLSFRRTNYYVSGSANASDGFNNQYTAELRSGDLFARFSARAFAEKERGRGSGGGTGGRGAVDRETIALQPRFQLNREFALTGQVGYEDIGTQDRRLDSQGLIWRAGFNWTPGPRTNLSAEYGRRYERDNIDIRLVYRLTPRVTIRGSVSDRRETQTLSFIRDLLDQTQNPIAPDVIDPSTGLPLQPALPSEVVGDEIIDERIYALAVSGVRGRHSLSLSQNYTERKRQTGVLALNDTWRTTLAWRYAFSPRLSGGLTGTFQQENRPGLSPDSNTISTAVNFSYVLSPRANLGVSAQRAWRNSDTRFGNFTQNSLALSATVRF